MIPTIHPFPARMAPELALRALNAVKPGGLVVDPMMGSGTVVRHATNQGLRAIGFDMDPLAVLMARVWTSPVCDGAVQLIYDRLAKAALCADPDEVYLPWIDDDPETRDFIRYWFGRPQIAALRCWASAILSASNESDENTRRALDVVRVALSRIIVTKEQCASLARDTSHSRPHRVTLESNYCVYQGLDRSLKLVRKRLLEAPPALGARVGLGDVRKLVVEDEAVDAILTSPPYLNAIDYLRGHRMSLVWLGYSIGELRNIRSNSIGAERKPDFTRPDVKEVRSALHGVDGLPTRYQGMIERYVVDLLAMAAEIKRVLKPGGAVTMVVGNSTLKSVFIENSAAVSKAMSLQGLVQVNEVVRELPSSSRYLPTSPGSSLEKRMRQETVLSWVA